MLVKVERWFQLVFFAIVLGIATARMWVYLPDWIRDDWAFWSSMLGG